jgi:hypothetical protein
MTKWTNIQPVPPSQKPSKFYWFLDPKHKEVWPVELWPGRYIKHYEGLWWPEPIEQPNINNIEELIEGFKKTKSKPTWKNVNFDDIKKGDVARFVAHANLHSSEEITVTKKYKDRITGHNYKGKTKLYRNDEQWQIRRK